MVQPDLAHSMLRTGTMRVLCSGQRKPFHVILPNTVMVAPYYLICLLAIAKRQSALSGDEQGLPPAIGYSISDHNSKNIVNILHFTGLKQPPGIMQNAQEH